MNEDVLRNWSILESTSAIIVDSKSSLSMLICPLLSDGSFASVGTLPGYMLALCGIMLGEDTRVGLIISVSVTDWFLKLHELIITNVMVINTTDLSE